MPYLACIEYVPVKGPKVPAATAGNVLRLVVSQLNTIVLSEVTST